MKILESPKVMIKKLVLEKKIEKLMQDVEAHIRPVEKFDKEVQEVISSLNIAKELNENTSWLTAIPTIRYWDRLDTALYGSQY